MHKWLMCAAAVVCGCAMYACGGSGGDSDAGHLPVDERAKNCPKAQSMDPIPQRLDATAPVATLTVAELESAVVSACAECHLKPASNGGFSFTRDPAGFAGAAEKMAQQLLIQKMPPDDRRLADPARFLKLGSRLQAWIAASKPETGSFPLPDETLPSGQQLPPAIASAMTDIGDCVPVAEVIGKDAERDATFARLTALPANLADTDLASLDAYELAKRGTVGYDVEYPLWADNAHKGRWVHVPTAADGSRQPIAFDPATNRFQIPDNTRFYKTFFKQVKESDGVVRYRKVETRLIVVRKAPGTPLFGTYVWDANEVSATLLADTYRDGTPFRDLVLQLETDATTHAHRTYAVPGRTRCNDCHQGSESDSFVLGFTPLQINRRDVGAAGRTAPVGPDELSQLTRLASYGVVAGITADTAPKLEAPAGAAQPRNIHELRYQGYATGNCAHCHNPKGYAAKQGIKMLLSPPNVFQFARGQNPLAGGASPLLTPSSTSGSMIYERMSQDAHVTGSSAILHMPLHTPGIDCNGVNLAGKWIMSIPKSTSPTADDLAAALRVADGFDSGCQAQADVTWLDEDFSDPPDYAPRRLDWTDAVNGIPDAIRALKLDDVKALADTPIANGYWAAKADCRFPEAESPPEPAPWMTDINGNPKRPWGELYYQKPGQFFFENVCSKCHGARANADSALAKSILVLTGGTTRVANLHDGLFGRGGANASAFNVVQPDGTTRNFAANYLVWMASGGTKAVFPPALGDIVGPQGGNMLYMVRSNYCALLLDNARGQYQENFLSYQVVFQACTLDNPITPDVGFAADHVTPLNAAAQGAWLDRASRNVGLMIFFYLGKYGAVDSWPADRSSCDVVYPAH